MTSYDAAPTCGPEDALEALVCFDLYAASRAVTAAYRPVLTELGLTYPQYLVLTVLWSRGPVSIKQLSSSLRLDHATLTPLLRRMEAGGLVRRERSLIDERSVTIALTDRGDAMREVREPVYCRISEVLGLAPEQVETLQDLLRQVTSNVDPL